MTRPVSTGRRSHRRESFDAPLGRSVKWMTALSLLILAAVAALPVYLQPPEPDPIWVRVMIPALMLGLVGGVSLFRVRGFVVDGRDLWVLRPLWQTRVVLQALKEAHADPTAMKGSWRTAGIGGLFVFCGWFHNRKLGRYRAFVTDPARSVVMEFKNRKVVVSPHDPAAFVTALGFGNAPKGRTD